MSSSIVCFMCTYKYNTDLMCLCHWSLHSVMMRTLGAVLVCGPLAGGCGSAHPSGPSEVDPLDHGCSEAHERSDSAPPASSSALSERSAPHSAASAACETPGGPAPDPGRYGWAAQPGRNDEAATHTQTHTHTSN